MIMTMPVQAVSWRNKCQVISKTYTAKKIFLTLWMSVIFTRTWASTNTDWYSASTVAHKQMETKTCRHLSDQVTWQSVFPNGSYHYCSFESWPEFKCRNGNCFTMQQTCDGHDDCGDSTDECESMCSQTFRCDDTCIAMDMFCDGKQDCADGSDEIKEDACEGEGFLCANRWRTYYSEEPDVSQLHWKERRVSKNFCAREMQNVSDMGAPQERKCVLPKTMVCDGRNHCGDHSDECSPEAKCGPDTKFICKNNKCIAKMHVCDGVNDCGDGSDECIKNCSKSFTCNDGTCISFHQFCNGVEDCPDGSDEQTFQSLSNMNATNESSVLCSNYLNLSPLKCIIPQRYVCDGHEHCVNREDECLKSCGFSFQCANGKCIVEAITCDGWDDCGDMSDECGEQCGKSAPLFQCNNGSCLALNRFCDGIVDCADGEDEDDDYVEDEFFCSSIQQSQTESLTKKCRLPQRYVCDGKSHCLNRADECETDCKSSFFCDVRGDDRKCIPRTSLCDGIADCNDLTDEPSLKGPISTLRGFKCMVPKRGDEIECVLPKEFVGDLNDDCKDGSDSCVINDAINLFDNITSCIKCLKSSDIVLSDRQLCDGVIDCPDLSDECLCQDNKILHICQHVCFDKPDNMKCPCALGDVPCLISKESKQHIANTYPYLNTHLEQMNFTQCIRASQFCDGHVDCENFADELYCDVSGTPNSILDRSFQKKNRTQLNSSTCRSENEHDLSKMTCFAFKRDNVWTPEFAIACDGNPECFRMEDECDMGCQPLPDFCFMRTPSGDFNCRDNQIIPGQLVCNGIVDCKTGMDEDELNCPGRTACKSGKIKTVENNKICNFVEDCDDKSDESNCNETHFYCENKQPFFIRRRKVMDGVHDCTDGSDECPNEFFGSNAFSSIDYMIKSPFLQVMVWIMGICSVVGNLSVFIHTVGLLNHSGRHKLTKVAVVYNVLVLNLSFADFLMGVFLIVLGVQNARLAGKYCLNDIPWRTGIMCSTLGVMATLSAEVSLTTLAILSSYRMYCVMRPIQSRGLQVHWAICFILCAWGLALCMSLLPLYDGFKNYFVSDVWMQNNIYFLRVLVSKQELFDFCDRVLSYDHTWASLSSGMTSVDYCYEWDNALKGIARSNTTHGIGGFFGYYGAHATCLPKIFLTHNDAAWEYSLGTTIYNFFVCLYIVFAYYIIWKPRQVNNTSIASQATRTMQKKIAILVVTDCACWLPICVLAFLRFSGVVMSGGVYAFTAIVLLPINSALNPVFYSNALQSLQDKIGQRLSRTRSVKKLRKGIRSTKLGNCQKREKLIVDETGASLLQVPAMRSSHIVTENTCLDSTALTESKV